MALDKLDYALIHLRFLEQLSIRISREKGTSCDEDANTLWHHDLQNLSGSKVVELAVTLQQHAKFCRVQKREVGHFITASIRDGVIDPNRIDQTLRNRLPASP